MTVNKITNAPTQNELIDKVNEVIDNLGGTSTDVQVNGTSITSNGVANIVTNTAYNASSNKIATMSDVPSNYVTTNTTQNITSEKTFVGSKKISFKQSLSNDKLGFTLYDNNNNEKGYLEYNAVSDNKVNGKALLTLGNYAGSSASNVVYTGFRRLSRESGKNGAYNLLTPLIEDAKTPFNLTSDSVYENFYFPLGFTDGTNTVVTAKTGMVDLTQLDIGGGATVTFREWN